MKFVQPISEGISLIETTSGAREYVCHGVSGLKAVALYKATGDIHIPYGCNLVFERFKSQALAEAYWKGVMEADQYNAYIKVDFVKFLNYIQNAFNRKDLRRYFAH